MRHRSSLRNRNIQYLGISSQKNREPKFKSKLKLDATPLKKLDWDIDDLAAQILANTLAKPVDS